MKATRQMRRRAEATHKRRLKNSPGAVTKSLVPNRQQLEELIPSPADVMIEIQPMGAAAVCVARFGRVKALLSIDEVAGGRQWYHVSVSAPGPSIPTWEELCRARELLFQPDVVVVQVFPPVDEWFSLHDVLHLWQRIGPDRLVPDLRREEGSL